MRDLIFDLDGTLIDSSECIFKVYTELFKELGMPDLPIEVKRTFIGPPVETVMRNYVPEQKVKEVCDLFRKLYAKVDLKKTNKLYDGIEEMLSKLKEKGRWLFIASTKNELKARAIPDLLGIGKYFTGIYGSLDNIGRISKLDVLNAMQRDWNIDKNDCILIGDTHYDAEGAEEFGIPVAIVRYGFGQGSKLKDYPVAMYFDAPADVADAL